MKMSSLQKAVAVSTLLVPTLSVFAPPSTAASTVPTQEIQTPSLERTSFQNEGVYQLAQGSDNCMEVAAKNRGVNGWVPISAPLQGYVSASYLTYCP